MGFDQNLGFRFDPKRREGSNPKLGLRAKPTNLSEGSHPKREGGLRHGSLSLSLSLSFVLSLSLSLSLDLCFGFSFSLSLSLSLSHSLSLYLFIFFFLSLFPLSLYIYIYGHNLNQWAKKGQNFNFPPIS